MLCTFSVWAWALQPLYGGAEPNLATARTRLTGILSAALRYAAIGGVAPPWLPLWTKHVKGTPHKPAFVFARKSRGKAAGSDAAVCRGARCQGGRGGCFSTN